MTHAEHLLVYGLTCSWIQIIFAHLRIDSTFRRIKELEKRK